MQISMIDLAKNHQALADEVEAAVQRVLRSGWYILGKEVQAFEEAFASYHGVNHAIAVANGTDAIELALRAWGIEVGDEVITVAHTAVPTVTAIERAGAIPVFVDILPDTYLMDSNAVEQVITAKTKAIIPVHLYGHPTQLLTLLQLANKYGLLLLEDCAQAHGAAYHGQRVGTFGQMAAFSFYPTKNLGAYGDAGAIITNDELLADRLKRLRNYGQESRYHHIERGVNSRMDDLQAAILSVKLPYLESHNDFRRQVAEIYHQSLQWVICPIEEEGMRHVYHLYVVRHPQRDALQGFLQQNGVQTAIHYPIPIHRQKSHLDLAFAEGSLPVTERIAAEILSIPLHIQMINSEQQRIIELIQEFCETRAE
jgi:dTDP-3-amino-3,4,6-trideoxy-alpha-D-glucose transaminase